MVTDMHIVESGERPTTESILQCKSTILLVSPATPSSHYSSQQFQLPLKVSPLPATLMSYPSCLSNPSNLLPLYFLRPSCLKIQVIANSPINLSSRIEATGSLRSQCPSFSASPQPLPKFLSSHFRDQVLVFFVHLLLY